MSVMDQQGQMVVENALVFDSNAFFYLNGAPAKITGDPVYPGQFRYDFFMRPGIDISQSGERASSPLYMLLLLFFQNFLKRSKLICRLRTLRLIELETVGLDKCMS